ncbi:MAG TPA: hypothetical protein VK817_22085 [Trebonia sp.]|nr:hypothetical protein [Trebonia sp.]
MARAATTGSAAGAASGAGAAGGTAPAGHFFLYGITTPDAEHSAGVQAVNSPAASQAVRGAVAAQSVAAQSASASAPAPVATGLATAPVASPDQAWLALATVAASSSGPVVTVSVMEKASATVAQKAVIALREIPSTASVLVTPVFSPDATMLSLVLGISVPGPKRQVSKRDPRGGGVTTISAPDWRSQHALAFFDRSTGAVSGPFYLGDEPSLALSTVVATASDLFVWTTPDPRATPRSKSHPVAPPLPAVSVFPVGEGKARLTVPSPAPWPGGEPAMALPSGDAARFVNSRTLHVVAAKSGDLRQVAVAPLNEGRAKPSPIMMTPGPRESLFLAKPSIGRAVIVDPASEFAVRNDVSFAAPAKPFGGLTSKAVLSPSGEQLYVLGGAKSGGLAVYDVASGKITGAYGDGRQYSGLYLLPSGTVLAVSQENPRLAYFSPELSPLATADTGMYVSAVY